MESPLVSRCTGKRQRQREMEMGSAQAEAAFDVMERKEIVFYRQKRNSRLWRVRSARAEIVVDESTVRCDVMRWE